VSQLKAFAGTLPALLYIPDWLHGTTTTEAKIPLKILARRIVKRRNATAVQYLVQWEGFTEDEVSWEFADEFERLYPQFEP